MAVAKTPFPMSYGLYAFSPWPSSPFRCKGAKGSVLHFAKWYREKPCTHIHRWPRSHPLSPSTNAPYHSLLFSITSTPLSEPRGVNLTNLLQHYSSLSIQICILIYLITLLLTVTIASWLTFTSWLSHASTFLTAPSIFSYMRTKIVTELRYSLNCNI